MQTPVNAFKQAMRAGQPQIGLWVGLADGYAAELLAGAGFDWLLIDGEHAPNDLRSVLSQLQAISSAWSVQAEAERSQPVVRVPVGDTALIKQYLELGAQTLLVPMVDTAQDAQRLASTMRYPPDGIRGMGNALARSSRWQTYPRYIQEANEQVCLLVQAETAQALQNIDAIAATPGVDGVFIGPADLSASMGFPGQPEHPQVQAAIADGIARILAAGKAPGILAMTDEQTHKWLDAGALFVAVGVDTVVLKGAASQLAAKFRKGPKPAPTPASASY
jgi:4-hydroxy-2-oxoheptanedioate aldolase